MIDFKKIKLIPISQRKNKFSIEDSISLENNIFLENEDLKELSEKIIEARRNNKQIIFMLGAHSLKVGLSLILIDLIKKGIITHLAVNGAFPIHDFEIALIGKTSESVENTIENGTFGFAKETLEFINEAAKQGAEHNLGYGESIARKMDKSNLKYKNLSVLYNAYKDNIPLTIHTAIGTEIIYQYPECSGEAIGKCSYNDFKLFTDSISKLQDGVILNIGSAVILPEVFLKALSIARNLDFSVKNFIAANLDMINHYRPRVNVVERPTSLGGKGFNIIGKHQETIPTLHKLILNKLN
ncbi:MAG: hypothetical protein ABIH72_03235 [archaeon]